MSKKTNKEPTVVERKLGKHGADGLYWEQQNTIEIDTRLDARNEIYVEVHEYNHHLHKDWDEDTVVKFSNKMAKHLWKRGYRKVKNK
jgi:Zn-dependent peptidase ImmA (M78 family)